VSGETVELRGVPTRALVQAIPQIERLLPRRITIVGGLAVLARLGAAYRVTGDIDIVNRRHGAEAGQLDMPSAVCD
jgi:hypothetical protein